MTLVSARAPHARYDCHQHQPKLKRVVDAASLWCVVTAPLNLLPIPGNLPSSERRFPDAINPCPPCWTACSSHAQGKSFHQHGGWWPAMTGELMLLHGTLIPAALLAVHRRSRCGIHEATQHAIPGITINAYLVSCSEADTVLSAEQALGRSSLPRHYALQNAGFLLNNLMPITVLLASVMPLKAILSKPGRAVTAPRSSNLLNPACRHRKIH